MKDREARKRISNLEIKNKELENKNNYLQKQINILKELLGFEELNLPSLEQKMFSKNIETTYDNTNPLLYLNKPRNYQLTKLNQLADYLNLEVHTEPQKTYLRKKKTTKK